jgi:hypothetical protein
MTCVAPRRSFIVLAAVASLTIAAPFLAGAGQIVGNAVTPTEQPENDIKEFPLNLAFAQDGSPLGLRGYLANAGSFYYETATVENISGRDVSEVTFGVVVIDREDRRTRVLLRSDPIPVSLASGETETVAIHLLPVNQLETFLQMFAKPQAMLGVLRVSWTDGTQWTADLPPDADDFANTGKAAEVSAWQIHSDIPSGAPDAVCYDDDGAAYSAGAIVGVQGDRGRFARCVNGGWMENLDKDR